MGERRWRSFRVALPPLLVLLLSASAAVAQRGGVAEYRHSLAEIEAALRAGDTAGARRAATALRGATFTFEQDDFTADTVLLNRVRRARSPGEARSAAGAVGRLVAAVDAAVSRPAAAGESDARLLARLARARAAEAIAPGGEVPELLLEEPGFWRSVREALARANERLRELLRRLLRRLAEELRGMLRERPAGRGALDTRMVTMLVAGLAVLLAALALLLLFRRRGAAAKRAAAPPPAFDPAADADPLSRRESEWARFAGELAAAGRYREAIRARYHAVLVALYGGGWLHYRKGRTNWEYVASLAPALPWRGDFIRLTRRFEEEWYGRRESREEAYLAATDEAAQVLSALEREAAA